MQIGLLGKKIGMTQLFKEDGRFVPVTAIEAGPCAVLSVKEGSAVLGFKDKKEKNTPKPESAFCKKINVKPKAFIKKMLFDAVEICIGQQITVDVFKEKDFVDITGISKGKGFQGGVKRWHWRGGPDSHGSMHHRRVGSIGASSYPSRVHKGQRLPGRMGRDRKTVQNIEVIKVLKDKNLMFVKGPLPGGNNGFLEIRLAKKKKPQTRQEAGPNKGAESQEKKKNEEKK
ncbi:50S ribosomal protein L3 [Candidatus Omnitrophota bacterium]